MYQSNPPPSPKETLPTMYDLPSEYIGDPGLPDTFHYFQAELLNNTFKPSEYSEEEVFSAVDLNLYYDVTNTNWYKRPDWFASVGVDRLYEKSDLRLSYVVWQEKANPFIVVELLSPGTEKEDLGQTLRDASKPPTKWQVYEQILRVPYYVIFDRYEDRLRIYKLNGGNYHLLELEENRLWLSEIGLGIGIWSGNYQGIERLWLRWYDSENNWIPTPIEIAEAEKQKVEAEKKKAEAEKQKAEAERQRADTEKQKAEAEKQINERLIAQLKALGIEPDF